jgi:hypothetical protein
VSVPPANVERSPQSDFVAEALKRYPLVDLRGEIPFEAGQQILIHTDFYHRDSRVFGDVADKFFAGLC